MKKCSKCGNENPSTALHCMNCGALLVEEESLTEEQKLQKRLQDTEKENELLRAALEAQLKGSDNRSAAEEQSNNAALEAQLKGSDNADSDSVEKKDDGSTQKGRLVEEGERVIEIDNGHEVEVKDNYEKTDSENQSSNTIEQKSPSNITLLILAIVLFVVAGIVGVFLYYHKVYLPEKRDAEAPRYYVYSTSLKIRNSTFFDGDANIVGRVAYGTELIVYDSLPGEYYYCKFAPRNAKGKVIKDMVVEGYVHYDYLLPKDDFFLLNSIFGNEDAKKMLSETRYRRALLQVFKQRNYIGDLSAEQIERYGLSAGLINNNNGRYQVFCRNQKAKSNNVYRSHKYRKDSKYLDAAIILDNLDNPDLRWLLYFTFNDDGTPILLISSQIQNKGYMKDGTLKLYEANDQYWINVEFEE